MSLKEKKAIVTGGAGFIGSHLCDLLLDKGHDVIVVDNFSTGRPGNLSHLRNHPRLTITEADITDINRLYPLFNGMDWVFHLAALADIVPSIQHPIAYHEANVDGTMAVVEAARHAGVKRLIYAASSSCYGIPDVYPTPEISDIQPMYPYALTKYLGEQIVLHWNRVYRLPTISLRLFNVFGTRSRTSGTYGAVFGVFLAQKLSGQPLTIVGDGKQTRDFTYVTDVSRAFLAAAESDKSGEVYNVGSGRHQSIEYLAELIGGDRIFIPKRPGEPDRTFADTARIIRELGWQPLVRFEDGVANVLADIEYWRDAQVWTSESIADATKDWFQYLG
jgi:UDP-glucose 4-epimerase